jgi:hypothetical protein
MNFIFFVFSLLGFYLLLFPLIMGLLALLFPNSLLVRFPRPQTVIASLFYGVLIGFLTYYFMNKPFVELRWLYILCGVIISLGLPYRLESISGSSFNERDSFQILSIWVISVGGFILALVII